MRRDLKHRILVTRPLSEASISYAHSLGLDPLIVPALKVEFPENWEKICRKIEARPTLPWIFSSRNAVRALSMILNSGYRIVTDNRIFAVGKKTAQALENLNLKAEIPDEQHVEGLAEYIINDSKTSGMSTLIYWSGNRSRDLLNTELTKAGLELVPLEVYQTLLCKMNLPVDPVKGVLFYSPSAVEAFRHNGGIGNPVFRESKLFAIGNTTGSALSLETGESVYVASEPTTKSILRRVADELMQDS